MPSNHPFPREWLTQPMWPKGTLAHACRNCRLYLHDAAFCPVCGAVTAEIVVFNSPNEIDDE